METQVILPEKPLHKAESPTNTWGAVPGLRLGRQFYLYTAMAQPLLPYPGLCPSNSNRNSIRQPMILVNNSSLTYSMNLLLQNKYESQLQLHLNILYF